MANTTEADWDEGSPVINQPRRAGALEINALRQAVRLRMAKEHETPDAASVGGEHLHGSARVYYQAAAPTFKPDGVTDLDDEDDGRLWLDSDNNKIYVYSAATDSWVDTTPAPDPTEIYSFNLPINAVPVPSYTSTGNTPGTYMVFVEGAYLISSSGTTLSVIVNGITKSVVLAATASGFLNAPFMLVFQITSADGVITLSAVSAQVTYLTAMSGFLMVAS